MSEELKPVAWQAKGDDGIWRYVEMPKTAKSVGYELRPLYAHPYVQQLSENDGLEECGNYSRTDPIQKTVEPNTPSHASNTLIEEQAARIAELEKYRDMADGYGKLDADYAIAEARLSEAVKVLEEAKHLLQDVADGVMSADGRVDDGIIDMQIVRDIKAFIATLGENKNEA